MLIAGREELEHVSTSGVDVKRFKLQGSSKEETPSCPCADVTFKLLDIPLFCCVGNPVDGNIEADDGKGEETISEEGKGEYFSSISDDTICRHHEVPRQEWNVLEDETFRIILNYADVKRQTRTSMNNASENTVDDIWNEDDVALSEEWIVTRRLGISRTKLPEGYKWVNGRLTNIQKTKRADAIWSEAWSSCQ